MTYIERAIKLAIVGGYKEGENWKFVSANRYWVVLLNGNNNEVTVNTNVYFLDKNFWVALGKSLNLGDFYDEEGSPKVYGLQGWYPPYGGNLENQMWAYEAMKFFQASLEGITPEEFFKELLKDE